MEFLSPEKAYLLYDPTNTGINIKKIIHCGKYLFMLDANHNLYRYHNMSELFILMKTNIRNIINLHNAYIIVDENNMVCYNNSDIKHIFLSCVENKNICLPVKRFYSDGVNYICVDANNNLHTNHGCIAKSIKFIDIRRIPHSLYSSKNDEYWIMYVDDHNIIYYGMIDSLKGNIMVNKNILGIYINYSIVLHAHKYIINPTFYCVVNNGIYEIDGDVVHGICVTNNGENYMRDMEQVIL